MTAEKPRKGRSDKGQTRGPYKEGKRSRKISVYLDADVAQALDEYQADVPDYSRNSTINVALRFFLAFETWACTAANEEEMDDKTEYSEDLKRKLREVAPFLPPR